MSTRAAILLRYRGGEVYAAGEHTGHGWLLTVCGVRLDVVIPARVGQRRVRWAGTLHDLSCAATTRRERR